MADTGEGPHLLRFDYPIDTDTRAHRRMARRFELGVKAYGNELYLLNPDGTRTRLGPPLTWRHRARRAYYRLRMWLA